MSITYIEAYNAENLRGYQIEINASAPVAQASAGHIVLWADSTGLRTIDASSITRTLATRDGTETFTNKTLTTPVIGDFASATHTHQNATNGGALDAAAIGTGTLDAARIPTLDASKIGTGVLNNARVNWAAPSAIGSTTPTTGTFTTLIATSSLQITLAAGNPRLLNYQSGGINRWAVYTDIAAESGSEAGSDFRIGRYYDNGVFRDDAMVITRSSRAVDFPGTVSKGGGTFKIDHPLDPANRNLMHSFVEGPRADLIYRGQVQLVGGQATVDIDTASGMTPGTFEALTKHTEADFFLQNRTGYVAVRGTLAGGLLTIQAQNAASTDTIAWLVVAERNDPFYLACELTDAQGRFVIEADKPALTPADEALLESADPDPVALAALVGKQGFAQHAVLTGHPRPTARPKKGK